MTAPVRPATGPDVRGRAAWASSILGFPIGGVAAIPAVGRVDSPTATTVGTAVGLTLGASAVGFSTSLGALALQGALAGAVLGPLQALALRPGARRWPWAAAAPVLLAAGWTVTTLAGVGVDAQFTTFGAAGALTYTALAGLLLRAVLPRTTRS